MIEAQEKGCLASPCIPASAGVRLLRFSWPPRSVDAFSFRHVPVRELTVAFPTSSNYDLRPASEEEGAYLESLIREDFERCHPGETLDDLKRRASFSKEDKGLLRDWMAIAASRAADQAKGPQLNSAA
jgi:hypothetical protein